MISNYKLKTRDLAKRLGVTRNTIYAYERRNALPAPLRLAGRRYWCEADVAKFEQYLIDRSTAQANGHDPAEVPRPAYSIPVDGQVVESLRRPDGSDMKTFS